MNSKLKSGGDGVSQFVLITALILLVRLSGQSGDSCRESLASLSGGVGKLQGELEFSPSICVNCCVLAANVASRHAFAIADWLAC